jgi:hypothetical protein
MEARDVKQPDDDASSGATPSPDRLIAISPKQVAAIDALLGGKSIPEAATAAGVDRTTVYRWLRADFESQARSNQERRASGGVRWPMPHATVAGRRRRRTNRKRGADLARSAIAAGISKLWHFVARDRELATPPRHGMARETYRLLRLVVRFTHPTKLRPLTLTISRTGTGP